MHCEKAADATALTETDFVGALNPPSHGLISSISVFVGETNLTKEDKSYMLISRLNYLLKYTKKARETFLNVFEGK